MAKAKLAYLVPAIFAMAVILTIFLGHGLLKPKKVTIRSPKMAPHEGYSQQYLEALKLSEYRMFEWVQMARKRGYNDQIITKLLAKNGWSNSMIKDALRYKDHFNESSNVDYLKGLMP